MKKGRNQLGLILKKAGKNQFERRRHPTKGYKTEVQGKSLGKLERWTNIGGEGVVIIEIYRGS